MGIRLTGADSQPPGGIEFGARGAPEGRPVTLVLDAYHHVSDRGVDRELIDLVRSHPLLSASVLSRVKRPIEAFAVTEPDCLVLRARDLALDGHAIEELARNLEVPIDGQHARQLAEDVGGWPALVRIALRDGLPRGRCDPRSIAPYLDALAADVEVRTLLWTMMRASLTERLDQGSLHALFRNEIGPEAVTEMLTDAGMMGPTGAVPFAVRRAAAAVFEELDPPSARSCHRALARQRESDGDMAAALHHAIRATDVPTVSALLTDSWVTLSARPQLVRRALSLLPPSLIGSRAELILLRESMRGTEPRWQAIDHPATGDEAARIPALLVHWALDRIVHTDVVEAEHATTGAMVVAQHLGLPLEWRAAAMCHALTLALLGKRRSAHRWFADAQRSQSGETAIEWEGAARDLTAWLLHVDGAPDGRPAPTNGLASCAVTELAILAEVIDMTVGVSRGQPRADAVAQLGGRWTLLRDVQEPSLAATAVFSALANLLIEEGELERAWELARHPPRSVGWSVLPQARVSFYSGDLDGAIRRTADCERWISTYPRGALDLLVVRACALLRTGDEIRAAQTMHLAVSVAQTHDLQRPFFLVPADDLRRVARRSERLTTFLDRLKVSPDRSRCPTPAVPVRLSRRELNVLAALDEGLTLAAISLRFYLSINTVKSHLRSVYAKLGVHSRAAAVRRARLLGLLDDDGNEVP